MPRLAMAALIAAALFLQGPLVAHAAHPPGLAAFVPDGWRVLKRLDANLDEDALPDTALLIANGEDDQERRLLAIIVGKNSQRLAGQVTLTPSMEPPELEVKLGVLIVRSSVGGATTVVDAVQRYRHEKESGRMRLIGLDVSRYSRTQQADQVELSFNTLTGDRVITTSRVIDERPDGSEIPWEERSYDAPVKRKERVAAPRWYMEDTPDPYDTLEAATR